MDVMARKRDFAIDDTLGCHLEERGDTLIEVLVAVVVIALAVTAIVGALVATIGASGEHRNLAVGDSLLKSYAENAKQQIQLGPAPLFSCQGLHYYQHHVPAMTALGYTVQINSVEYWDGSGFGPPPSDKAACLNRVQLIGITATANGRPSQQLSFVVRNPSYAPPD
jgi:type II secretory pathway pseudopilin PulG